MGILVENKWNFGIFAQNQRFWGRSLLKKWCPCGVSRKTAIKRLTVIIWNDNIYSPQQATFFWPVFHDFLDFQNFSHFIFSDFCFFGVLVVKKMGSDDFSSHPVGTKVKLRIFALCRGFHCEMTGGFFEFWQREHLDIEKFWKFQNSGIPEFLFKTI